MDLLHKSTRARTLKSFHSIVVVLARLDRCLPWCDCQHEVGGVVHHCVGGKLDRFATMGVAWRFDECVNGKSRNTTPVSGYFLNIFSAFGSSTFSLAFSA